MKNPKTLEFIQSFGLAVAVLAVIILGYGIYQWYQAGQRINEIEDEFAKTQALVTEVSADANSQAEVTSALGRDFMSRDIALRTEKIEKQEGRDDAIRIIGVSIAVLAGAWLARDLATSRLKKITA